MSLTGLYAITDGADISSTQLLRQVESALMGGANIVQYRNKHHDNKNRMLETQQLKLLCDHYAVPLLINDDIELALSCQASGVHLGKHDTDIKTARDALGKDAIIGISCYNELERAINAQARGANYIAFGSFYPSQTKPNAVNADIELIKHAKAKLTLPVCAIGGINIDNAKPLIDAGADMLAVISGIFQQTNIQQASKNIASLFLPPLRHEEH